MSDVELKLTADLDQATKEVSGFRKQYAELVRAVEKPLRQVNAFRELESSLESTSREIRTAKDRVRELAAELARTSAPAKELQADYRNATQQLKQLENQEARQIGQLRKQQAELKRTGIDTRNLASEQKRLQGELGKQLGAGRADAALSSAKKALDVGAIEQTQQQLVALRQQYQLVSAASGLSAKQRGEAEAGYRRNVSQTLATLRQLRTASAAPTSKADAAQSLKQEAVAAAEAARQHSLLTAQRALGVGKIRSQQQELVKLRAQYRLVMTDASMSATQRAEAEAAYRRRVAETLEELRKLRAGIKAGASASAAAAAAEAQRNIAAREGIRSRAAALAQVTREQRQSNIEAARGDLGVNRYRALQVELGRVQAQYSLLRKVGGLTNKELAVAQQTLNRRINESRQAMRELVVEQRKLGAGSGQLGLGGTAGLLGAAYSAARASSAYIEITDASKQMDAQLRLVTKSQGEFNQAQQDTYRIAQENKAPLEDVTRLYARLTPALVDIGRGQREVAGVTEALTAALRISGATQSETASTLTQFSQALGSGVLRGEEFNAIAENAPRLLRALAEGLNVPTGALRDMASEGALTADVITDLTLKALPQLIEEAKNLPETVGSSLTTLRNDVIKAFGDGDTSGFINAITQLRTLLTDPQVVQGLMDLAGGMATLAGWTVTAATEFAGFAKEVAFAAAQASGYIDELTKLEKDLAGVNAARTGGQVIGRPTATFFMSPADLDAWAKELEGKIEETRAKINGVTVEQQRDQESAAAASKETAKTSADYLEVVRAALLDDYRTHISETKKLQDEHVKAAEAGAKALVASEKKAQSELKKIRDDRLKIEERYQEALAGLGGDGDASYGNAQALKVGAREALAGGDIKGAQAQAQAALKMLQDLAAAGESTYGFAGFIKELQAIELAANDIEQTNAEAKIAAIKAEMLDLKVKAAALEDMPVSVKMDDAALAAVKSAIADLANTKIMVKIGAQYDFTTPYTLQDPGPAPPAFAAGDMVRGPGTGTSDSILARLSNGEFVMRAAAVRHYGPELLRQLNERRLPKFADGGMISPRAMPSIPQMSPSLLSQGGGAEQDWGIWNFQAGDQSHPVLMPRSTAEELRIVARKLGKRP